MNIIPINKVKYNSFMYGVNQSANKPETLKHVLPTTEQAKARSDICRICDKYRPHTDVCGMCGCGAVISQRAKSPLGKCPLDKWDK